MKEKREREPFPFLGPFFHFFARNCAISLALSFALNGSRHLANGGDNLAKNGPHFARLRKHTSPSLELVMSCQLSRFCGFISIERVCVLAKAVAKVLLAVQLLLQRRL